MEPLDLFSRRQVLTVHELVSQIKKLVAKSYDFVWVEGEVSGLRRPGSGHLYFSLKDSEASLRAVLFRHQAAMLRFALEDGLKVLCQGRVSVYGPRGDLQLVVDTVEPQGAGQGEEEEQYSIDHRSLFPGPIPLLHGKGHDIFKYGNHRGHGGKAQK